MFVIALKNKFLSLLLVGTMDSYISRILNYVARGANLPLRIVLLRLFCVSTAFLCLFIVVPSNMLQEVSPYLNPAVAVYAIMVLGIYLLSLNGIHLLKTFYTLLLILLNISWFINGGTTGSISYFFICTAIIPVVLFTHKTRFIMLLLMSLNYTVLVLLEQRFPSLIVPFVTIKDRYFDLLTGFVVSILTTWVILQVIISNYDRKLAEHKKAEEELDRYRQNLEVLVDERTKRLQESEEKFRSVMALSPDIISILSEDGSLLYNSPACLRIHGYSPDEMIGTNTFNLIHPDDQKQVSDAMGNIISNPMLIGSPQFRYKNKDGSYVWMEASGSNQLGNPLINGIVVVSRCIEDRKRAEEEKLQYERQLLHTQKLESLGVMAGGIAHDFNNLLQSILGNLEIAEKDLIRDTELQMHISSALISGRQATHLTSLLLAYIGRGFIEKKELNLNEIVRDNAEIFRSAASASVSIEMSLSPDIQAIIADEAHIQQLVMNLITNAAESIEKPPGFVRITTGVQYCEQEDLSASLLKTNPEPGRYVFLEVCDNGCGMSESTISRLFDPFFTTKSTGRGLGMSAVMGIMKTYSGALILGSESEKGSTFRALFPVSESARHVDVHEYVPPSQEEQTVTLKPISGLVLVVDDEKTVLRTCAKMVRLCGLEVITAINGVDAIAKFQERADEIDLVLMDLTMPHMDGITASENIYHIRPNTKIILASGFNKEEIDKRVSGHPPAGFISKPYSMKELEEEIRKVCKIL